LIIGIETRPLQPRASGGIVQNQIGVFREVFACYPEHRYVVFCAAANRTLFAGLSDGVRFVELPAETYPGTLGAWLAQHPVDVLFRSYPDPDPLDFPLARQIVYIPDNQHDFLPELFEPPVLDYRRRAFGQVLAGAGAIGTISEFSRAALAERAPAGRDIFFMSPALQRDHIALAPVSLDPAETAMLPRTPFFYYPANLWPHKNHRRVIDAFRAFSRDAITGYALVLTGYPEGWPEIAAKCRDLDVRHLGYVSPRLVGRLFQDAMALAFFSQFEGFGIPLLEAFHAGTPVLCSNVGSRPEVAGDAALMVDPTDIGAMAAAMRRIAMDVGLRRELTARGRQRLHLYGWRRSAENFMAVCIRVAERTAEASGESMRQTIA
jgi:glycosyltransferase involved in cell wall biosynthesis